MRFSLFKDKDSEPRVYGFTIDYSNRDKTDSWMRHGGWFLFWPGNERYVQWFIFPGSSMGWSIAFDDVGETDMKIRFTIPFIVTLYFGLRNTEWLLRLLGLTWKQVRDKPSRDWRRELGISWHSGALWIIPWVNDNEWSRGHRSSFSINPADIIFGKRKYSEYEPLEYDDIQIVMPEGTYKAMGKTYKAQWKRPRWPFKTIVNRVDLDIPAGIPIPGKGENSWDLDDDATFGGTYTADSLGEAIEKLSNSILKTRADRG